MSLLFPRFEGLPEDGFAVFSIEDRDARRTAIIDAFHPALKLLGEDLVEQLASVDEPGERSAPFHAHLPRLDWPRGYEPFATWLALSREAHGYQAGPQLNVGVHADHVAFRLGWDTAADAFGRFEFLCRRGDLGRQLVELAERLELRFRVYASAPWPQGSRQVFDSPTDINGSFAEVQRRGVWWELGRRYELPGALPFVTSTRLGGEIVQVFVGLLPAFDRIVGEHHERDDSD